MAAVALSSYDAPSLSNGEIFKHPVDGDMYYACETTVNGYQPVGASAGTYGDHYYSEWISDDSEYRFYLVD